MPARAASICRHPGCGRRIPAPGYCETHAHFASNWVKREDRKGSTTSRGYGWKWQKLRAHVLKRDNGLCLPCGRRGRVTEATDVDHIVAKTDGGTDDPGNLQSICAACHKAKTARERIKVQAL